MFFKSLKYLRLFSISILFFGYVIASAFDSIKIHHEINPQVSEIKITEGDYEGRTHFIIGTPTATYYYDKAGGGFSRMLDADGTDWINYKTEPWDNYPASAASAYRGIANLVFGSDDSGAGHPGHNKCMSKQLNDFTIITESISGKWQWKWEFFADYAQLTMLKIDIHQPYWFLYEGYRVEFLNLKFSISEIILAVHFLKLQIIIKEINYLTTGNGFISEHKTTKALFL
ncbi:MAG: hypothetical protein IPL46_00180 [Saprospiraceae bacterium]|nr:hypothetical protein [Saprospiraceae bacterium]